MRVLLTGATESASSWSIWAKLSSSQTGLAVLKRSYVQLL
jgi:hypothetical protein